MDEVTFIKVVGQDAIELEHAIIDHGNEEFTSMLKSTYDAQQAEFKPKTKTVVENVEG